MSAHVPRAQLLIQQDRNDLAEQELRLALAEDPSSVDAHALLATCLASLKRWEEATAEARAAIGHGPDAPVAHLAMAHVLLARNHPDEAVEAAKEAGRLDPELVEAWSLQSAAHLAQRRWREALDAAERGLALEPESVRCADLRAHALIQLGRRSEAAETIRGALQRSPEDASVHAAHGWAMLHEGRPKEAMEHFREALRLDPDMEFARGGIVEAMKARWWPYGLLLRLWLRLGRFGRKGQWAIVVGLVLVVNLASRVGKESPSLKPWTDGLTTVYFWFAVATWTAGPVFDLLLHLNRFGRLALSRDQRRGATLIGAILLGALGCLGLAAAGWKDGVAFATGFVLLMLPASAVFSCAPGRPRWIAAAVTLVLAAIGAGILGFEIAVAANALRASDAAPAVALLVPAFLWGCVLSTWVLGIARGIETRH